MDLVQRLQRETDEKIKGMDRTLYFNKYCKDCKNATWSNACAYCLATETNPSNYEQKR